MSALKWTKSYELLVGDNNFRIFISERDENQFFASCLWFDEGRLLKAPGQTGSLEFHLEKRFGNSGEDALNALLRWVKEKHGEEFELKEINEKSG